MLLATHLLVDFEFGFIRTNEESDLGYRISVFVRYELLKCIT